MGSAKLVQVHNSKSYIGVLGFATGLGKTFCFDDPRPPSGSSAVNSPTSLNITLAKFLSPHSGASYLKFGIHRALLVTHILRHPESHPIMSTFSLFPKLPPEIRSQIWECALPSLGPGVHFFRAGCWTPRYLSPSDDEYEPGALDDNRYALFDHTRINKTWLAFSIIDVNREARQAALRWAQRYHLQLCFLQERQELVFLRHYSLEKDTLYITPERWERFVQETMAPDDQRFMNNMFSISSYIDRIVIPASFFEEAIPALHQIFQTHDLDALYVSETVLEPVSDGFDPSYQYEPSGGATVSWNSELQRFDFEAGNEEMDRPEWYKLLNQAAQTLAKSFTACRRENELSIMAVRLYKV